MPTALELTREEWQPYIEASLRRPESPGPDPSLAQQRKELLRRLQELAVLLKARFKVQRVVLFGSAVYPDSFSRHSDVDLAVEGLRNEDFWDAWRVAEEIVGDRAVDLVDVETARESLLRSIARDGMEL